MKKGHKIHDVWNKAVSDKQLRLLAKCRTMVTQGIFFKFAGNDKIFCVGLRARGLADEIIHYEKIDQPKDLSNLLELPWPLDCRIHYVKEGEQLPRMSRRTDGAVHARLKQLEDLKFLQWMWSEHPETLLRAVWCSRRIGASCVWIQRVWAIRSSRSKLLFQPPMSCLCMHATHFNQVERPWNMNVHRPSNTLAMRIQFHKPPQALHFHVISH